MKKRGKYNFSINFSFSDRVFYSLIAILILVIIGVGVYALTPGTAPNPGHLISETSPPSNCGINQLLQWTGSDWICVTGFSGLSSCRVRMETSLVSSASAVGTTSTSGYSSGDIEQCTSFITSGGVGSRFILTKICIQCK